MRIFAQGHRPGPPWASVVAQWCGVAVYFTLIMLPAGLIKGYRLPWPAWFEPAFDAALFRYSGPTGWNSFFEVTDFPLFLLAGRPARAKTQMAATTLALTSTPWPPLPMLGLGIGCRTIVGHQWGGTDPDLAERATLDVVLRIAEVLYGGHGRRVRARTQM